MAEQLKQRNALYWLVILSVLLFGGFYDWAAASLGVAATILSLRMIRKKQAVCYTSEKWFFLLLCLMGTLVSGMFFGIDRGMSLIGFIRFIPVISWTFLCMQYSHEDRKAALKAVPDAGVVMVLTGIAAYLLPDFRHWLWAADRLGGFFQYSNTCAIFLLSGMAMVEGKEDLREKIKWSLLFLGILLTGSRIVMVMTLTLIILQLIRSKSEKSWKYYILGNLAVAFFAAVVVVALTGSYQNLARLATVFTSNSTFYGRLLYWQDALGMILSNPPGLGYMGYYYIQPAVQTGVYTTMYVHNDFLQWFLDGGWIAGISFFVLMASQLIGKSNRKLLAILVIHGLADFDFQYTAIWFVAILAFDFGKINQCHKKEIVTMLHPVIIAITAFCCYFIMPFMMYYQGKYHQAISLYPAYTQAKEALLSFTADLEEAEELADDIISSNPYLTIAYDAKAMVAYARGDIKKFSDNKEKVLEIARYDITHYRDYDYLLEQYKTEALARGETGEVEFCIQRQKKILELLKETEKETSYLAWKIRDLPVFSLESEGRVTP